jgi:hypothetical protein
MLSGDVPLSVLRAACAAARKTDTRQVNIGNVRQPEQLQEINNDTRFKRIYFARTRRSQHEAPHLLSCKCPLKLVVLRCPTSRTHYFIKQTNNS